MTLENQKRLLHIVYGEKRETWPLNELSCAKRLLGLPGMTLDRVGLLMAVVSSSRHWESIIVSAEKLELHLDKLNDILARDPSAPGNRAGEEAYHSKPDTADQRQWKTDTAKRREERIAEVQGPWLDLIDEARAAGMTGPRVGTYVFKRHAELHPEKKETSQAGARMFGALAGASGRVQVAERPGRRLSVVPQRAGDPSAPKRIEPEETSRQWIGDEEGEGE